MANVFLKWLILLSNFVFLQHWEQQQQIRNLELVLQVHEKLKLLLQVL